MASSPISSIAQWLAGAERAVVFTGAGISTESGIPDFRSPGGIWTRFRTVYYDEFMSSGTARHEYWQQKSYAHREFADAEPNVGHRAIAEWEATGRIRGVVTQNIDGLHQLAGSRCVLELHGTARQIMCQDCQARYEAGPLVAQFLDTNRVPWCSECGSNRMKHATVSFGQSLPHEVLEQAQQWCQQADLLLAIGSSLVVKPAADLPVIAKHGGPRLVIINRDPTPLDSLADLVVNDEIGSSLAAINHELSHAGE